MLKLFALFHLNLMYSSIAEKDRPEVIARCYEPLLDLAESGLPVAIEASGLTLELAAEIAPTWLQRLSGLLASGVLDFVGSGYSQIIAPLVPARVNRRNLDLGRQAYARLLGRCPEIWQVNELTWSGGLPRLYTDLGARAVVMEWNNAWKAHPEWDRQLRYHWQTAAGCDGAEVPVIWVDTLDFQKMQRRSRQEIAGQEFLDHWRKRHRALQGDGFAAVYGNDAEIFGFRPGRYRDEGGAGDPEEWSRFGQACRQLAEQPEFELVGIDSVLLEPATEVCGRRLRLETTRQPILVKKQEKYNLNRWAVTGRGDVEANTACHCLAARLHADPPSDDDPWRRLCRLWSSDFRTHITGERWQAFAAELPPATTDGVLLSGDRITPSPSNGLTLELKTAAVACLLDLRRGLAVKRLDFAGTGDTALGTLAHGFFEDIALGADFYSGHAVVQRPGQSKRSDLQPCPLPPTILRLPDGSQAAEIRLQDEELHIHKQVVIRASEPVLELRGRLELPGRVQAEIHPAHLTIVPGFFDSETLGFAVHNGGGLETFGLDGSEIHHGQAYSTLITAKSGLGASEGVVMIGDRRRRLVITHDPCISALVPTIQFVPDHDGRYFLRLRYTAQEIDETFVASEGPWSVDWVITVRAEDRGLESS